MQNRISYYILSLLHLHGSVKIPGLGRIRQERAPAHPDPVSGRIAPPQTTSTLQSREKETKPGMLERYVSYKTQISRTRARKEILRFSHEIREELKQEGKADIGMLGQIRIEDDQIHFEPNETLLNPGFANWPEVTLPERLPDAEPLSYPALPEEPVPADGSASTQEFAAVEITGPEPIHTPAEVPAAISAVPDPIPLESKLTANDPEPENPAPEPEPEAVAGVVDASSRENKAQKYILIPVIALLFISFFAAGYFLLRSDDGEPEHSDVTTPVETQYNQKPRVSDTIAGELPLVTTGTTADPETGVAEETTPVIADTDASDVTIDAEEEQEVQTSPTPSTEQVSYDTLNGCLIVTGAFSQTINADRMVRRLQSLGYAVRMIQHGTLAQVGVPVDCASPELHNIVTSLRATVDSATWVLRPE